MSVFIIIPSICNKLVPYPIHYSTSYHHSLKFFNEKVLLPKVEEVLLKGEVKPHDPSNKFLNDKTCDLQSSDPNILQYYDRHILDEGEQDLPANEIDWDNQSYWIFSVPSKLCRDLSQYYPTYGSYNDKCMHSYIEFAIIRVDEGIDQTTIIKEALEDITY